VSEGELREGAEGELQKGAELEEEKWAEERGAEDETWAGEGTPLYLPTPSFMAPVD